jgi:hypothetical protein
MFCLRTFCSSGRFVPTDVLFAGRFVLPDVLSRRVFCPYGCFVPRMLCLWLLCHRTFCLRAFCSYGCFAPTDVLSQDVLSGHLLIDSLVYSSLGSRMRIRIIALIFEKIINCSWAFLSGPEEVVWWKKNGDEKSRDTVRLRPPLTFLRA